MKDTHVEIEVRFIEIDKERLIRRLVSLGAEDFGEDFLRETIFYDTALSWREQGKLVRMRKTKRGIFVTFKHRTEQHSIQVKELEFLTSDEAATKLFLEELDLVAFREQEKKRHTFQLGDVTVDIDTWPTVPSYVELEGPSEEKLREAAKLLGLDWQKVIFGGAAYVLRTYYNIPVKLLRYFTFDRVE